MDLRTLQPGIVAGLTVLTIALLKGLTQRGKPASVEGLSSIRFSRTLGWAFVVASLAMLAGGVALWLDEGGLIGPVLAIIGLVCLVAVGFSLNPNATVSWSDDHIDGPIHRYQMPMPHGRVLIAWQDIVLTGDTWTEYWYVEARDGRRIHWNAYYTGCGALHATLRAKRPDLVLPPGMK